MNINLHGVCHFYNEELLLPSFCMHHAPIFDSMTCIDSNSTDDSALIISELCPDWKIVKSKYPDFDAEKNTWEVGEYERQLPTGPTEWKLALNISEFIWHGEFKRMIERVLTETQFIADAYGMESFCLVDKEPQKLDIDLPFYLGRTWGFKDKSFGFNVLRHKRWVHRGEDGQYDVGRHSTRLPKYDLDMIHLLHASFSPWPQAKARKLQIQTQMPESDKQAGRGIQHIQTEESLNHLYNNYKAASGDLTQDEFFNRAYRHFSSLWTKSWKVG